ncbi:MAG TPA: tRNA epoxyqueuosine(34) reductase QueG [Vicinamibacterales bacterium]|nr:tRNA epoxyqueuosine(34) reductase QueG [Vicinamibacterales bacterium]
MAELTRDRIIARAKETGFDLCGIARAERHPRLARLADWIVEGRAGEMTYLAESLDERLDPRRVLPTARSIVSVAVVYHTKAAGDANPPHDTPPRRAISRYAWGDDYHDILKSRLRALLVWMQQEAGPGFEAFSCVDAGPVQERVFAEQAGLGWIGKHTCLINPHLGSWLFLGEILTNLDLQADAPAIDQCGTCTRCLDACPTGAITAPYELDARRCLSYLTIETRGALAADIRDRIGAEIYGCDICQDVCPWNRRAATSDDPAWQPRPPLASPTILDLCRLSDDAWRAVLKGSAMKRAGLRRIRRTLAYATRHLPVSPAREARDALRGHASSAFPEVADAIAWAESPEPA